MLGPDELLRLECLRLALSSMSDDPVAEARKYANFVAGRNDERAANILRCLEGEQAADASRPGAAPVAGGPG